MHTSVVCDGLDVWVINIELIMRDYNFLLTHRGEIIMTGIIMNDDDLSKKKKECGGYFSLQQ